jgi:hypothetical protein
MQYMFMGTAKEDRKKVNKVKQQLGLLEKLRLSFIVGRPMEVAHTPVSGVSAAQSELKRLGDAIAKTGIEAQAEIALLVNALEDKRGKIFPITHYPQQAASVIGEIARLREPVIVGLLYVVVELKTLAFEFWTKAFVRGREAEKTLDLAVADYVRQVMKHGN